jgi:hypothetical protein
MATRLEILKRIIALHEPLKPLIEELANFPWDSTSDLTTIEPQHVRSVLERYIAGQLTRTDLQTWAETLEVREDVEIDSDMKQFVFRMANPDIHGNLETKEALSIVDDISKRIE